MTLGTSERPLEILLVEDNPGDVELTKRMLQDSKFSVNIQVAEDGEVALALLRRDGEHATATRPDLILLDLSMPNVDGIEVLKELARDDELKSVPVMVLTSTQAQRSIVYSLGIQPSHYCQKPLELNRFSNLVNQLRTAPPAEETVATPKQTKRSRWWPFGGR